MSEVLWNLMDILYKRGDVEYHGSLNANVLKEYNLEVPGLRPAYIYHISNIYTKTNTLVEVDRS